MELKTVDEVCDLLKARGFDDSVLQEFRRGESLND